MAFLYCVIILVFTKGALLMEEMIEEWTIPILLLLQYIEELLFFSLMYTLTCKMQIRVT